MVQNQGELFVDEMISSCSKEGRKEGRGRGLVSDSRVCVSGTVVEIQVWDLWKGQSIGRDSRLEGTVDWKGQSIGRDSRLEGTVDWKGQSIGRDSRFGGGGNGMQSL
jgi:hypothetical protein